MQEQATTGFLSRYVQPDGRVVRLDQGRDTVSEGQAYGMLLAEALGEDGVFDQIWKWTRDHLQLSDGLFAFHANPAGHVISPEPASDADLLIAWALLRYRGPGAAGWHLDGHRVADAILAHEVVSGPWRDAGPDRGALGSWTARNPRPQLLVPARIPGPRATHRQLAVGSPRGWCGQPHTDSHAQRPAAAA